MLDLILLSCLVLGVPARAIWLSRRRADDVGDHRSARYLKTIALALVLMGLLAADWIKADRSPDMLGLALPLSMQGTVGLVLAALVLAGLAVAMALGSRQQKQKTAAPAADAALLPATRHEFVLFLALSVIIGSAWEVLYRGFLLWDLTPRVGVPGAVVVASAAYAAAHGFKSPQKFAASLVAALVFTTAYVLTRSLWWLMVIHTGLPVLAAAFHLRRLNVSAAPEHLTPAA